MDKETLKAKELEFNDSIKNIKYYQNYIIIIILSVISVFFLPMLGSSGDINFNAPTTLTGWIIWSVSKLSIIILNILIFDQFVKQARVNVRNDERYVEAENLLNLIDHNFNEIYYHPMVYIKKKYKEKSTTLIITTILSVFGLTNAILQFDWVTLLTYAFTIAMGLIFGWVTMLDTENIWTEIYLKFARQEYRKYEESLLKEVSDASNSEGE